MRRPAATAALAALLAGPGHASPQGVPSVFWTVGGPDPARQPAGTVNLALIVGTQGRDAALRRAREGGPPYAGPGRTGNVPLGELEGLTSAQISAADARVRFYLRRPAGTFACEGTFHGGNGSGSCGFAADAGFAGELERRGIGPATEVQLLALAMHEVELGFVEELASQGYATPSAAELVMAGEHGVGTAFLRSMGGAGLPGGTVPGLVLLADHGVTPELVRGIRALGYTDVTPEQLAALADHEVTPEAVRRINERAGSRQSIGAILRYVQRG